MITLHERCCECPRELVFMEGPMCDGCLDRMERTPGAIADLGGLHADDWGPLAPARDLFAVNLQTHEVIYFDAFPRAAA
jgi:hypothetical protein